MSDAIRFKDLAPGQRFKWLDGEWIKTDSEYAESEYGNHIKFCGKVVVQPLEGDDAA